MSETSSEPGDGPSSLALPLPSNAAVRAPSTLLLAIGAAALTFLMFRAQALAVWQTGAFFDTDDAMRLAQVRALLDGQGWFDMTARAMDPPDGVFLHWSRVVDVPLALLLKTFDALTDRETAERLTRLAFPFALLVGLYLGMARLGGLLMGPVARFPAMTATVISGNGIAQFVPGRIDHHAPQIVILVFMLGFAIESLDAVRARRALVAGCLAALSLAISLENLPFIVSLAACFTGLWVWRGAATGKAEAWFALGLGGALIPLFAGTTAPARYAAPVCDALSAAHLGPALIAAVGLGIAARAPLESKIARFGAAAAIAGLVAAFVWRFYPTCLGSPFVGLDPLVREIWMDNVEEALSFARLIQKDASTALACLLPVALGLAASLFAAWRSASIARQRFSLLSVFIAAGLALSLWQARVFTSITAVALLGGVFLATAARQWCLDRNRENLGSFAWLLLFPFTATAWSLALPGAPTNATAAGRAASSAPCFTPRALAPLAGLPRASVLAPLDLGSFLIADTKLLPYAGAYHRNNDGNHFALATMLAAPDAARRMMAARGVTYLLVCPGASETQRLAARDPASLAAMLVADRIPTWLAPVPLQGTPLRLFKPIVASP